MMFKKDLIHHLMKSTDHCLQERIGLMKDELRGKIMTEFAARPKTYSYLRMTVIVTKRLKEQRSV